MAVQVRATYQLKGWQGNQFKARVSRIMQAYQTPMDQQLKEEIQKVQFPLTGSWPTTTRRRNGQVVTSPRNIVDLGGFIGSQRRAFDGRATITFTWDAKSKDGFPYAPLILRGYTTRRGTVVPGRDWIKPALQNLPLDKFFAQQWQRLERGGA